MALKALVRKTAVAALTCAVLGLSPTGRADVVATLDPAGFLFPPPQYFGLATGGASHGTPSAGAFYGTFDGIPIVFFCVELSEYFNFSTNYVYTESLPDNPTFTQLGQLFTGRFGSIIDPQSSAAFQLAVWEIYFDTDLSLSNVTGFHVTSGPLATVTMAQGWLDNLASFPDEYAVHFLYNRSHQNFVTGTPVPEPAPLMLVGIGLLAMLVMHRRRAIRALR